VKARELSARLVPGTVVGVVPDDAVMAFDVGAAPPAGEDGAAAEVERIVEHAGGAPVAGFYTYGEIARVRGGNGFHNQTLVALALS